MSFSVDLETAYDYLVDPAHRAEWQSSLRGVEDLVGEAGVVGQTWHDVTAVGIRPLMELADADRPHRWTECGTWRGFRAHLTLTFTSTSGGCEVCPLLELSAAGLLRPAGVVLDRVAPLAVRADLRRASRVLGSG